MNTQKVIKVAGKTMLLVLLCLPVCQGQVAPAVSPKAEAAQSKPKAVEAEEYSVLNPRADRPAIDARALAPRLASLEGKTVYVYGLDFVMSPGQEIMLMVARGLAQAVPGIKVVYISDRYGDATADALVPAVRIARDPVNTDNWNTFKEAEKADAVVNGSSF